MVSKEEDIKMESYEQKENLWVKLLHMFGLMTRYG